MAETLAELRALSDDEVIGLYDHQARGAAGGLNYYLAELNRREQDRHTRAMLAYTAAITRLTWVMTIATIVSAVAALVTVFVAFR